MGEPANKLEIARRYLQALEAITIVSRPGSAPAKNMGEVRGYYYGHHFCGTVQPLS